MNLRSYFCVVISLSLCQSLCKICRDWDSRTLHLSMHVSNPAHILACNDWTDAWDDIAYTAITSYNHMWSTYNICEESCINAVKVYPSRNINIGWCSSVKAWNMIRWSFCFHYTMITPCMNSVISLSLCLTFHSIVFICYLPLDYEEDRSPPIWEFWMSSRIPP